MRIVNSGSVMSLSKVEARLTQNDKNEEALNAVNKWESDAPSGENRSIAANNIRDVIARNATELKLSKMDISSLPDILPESITEINIFCCYKLSTLPDALPSGLTKLGIHSCHELSSLPKTMPENFIELTINNCTKILNSIISLPDSLQKVRLVLRSNERHSLQFEKLPVSLKSMSLSPCFLVKRNVFRESKTQLNGIATSAGIAFKLGDVLYGLFDRKKEIISQISHFNNLSSKDIVAQPKITDTVWEHRDYLSFDKYRDETIIKEMLNDAERGIKFKTFLSKHEKYNIIERHEKKPYRPNKSVEDICLSRTSKAGLEFQIMERNGRVFFCADDLVESISEIAQKEPDYGTSITASELRWLYRHKDHPKIKSNVQFCLDGEFISQEKVFSLPGWENYHPKSNFIHSDS
ncbi:type III secretion protein GogB [Yersinia mollaretii]|nr:type III secretion protein GogB [Yersinia mollaretii]CQQ84782.1 type III secretion protein GogB [Yersinia mollaretii]